MSLIDKSIMLFFVLFPWISCAQDTLGGMEFHYQPTAEGLAIHLLAPTTGWVAIGFHTENTILGADLLQFRVRNGQAYGEDQLVQALGVHPADERLRNGSNQIRQLEGYEEKGWTHLSFLVPWNSEDPNDLPLSPDQSCWFILAYSQSDDFDHHSTMRKHVLVTW